MKKILEAVEKAQVESLMSMIMLNYFTLTRRSLKSCVVVVLVYICLTPDTTW